MRGDINRGQALRLIKGYMKTGVQNNRHNISGVAGRYTDQMLGDSLKIISKLFGKDIILNSPRLFWRKIPTYKYKNGKKYILSHSQIIMTRPVFPGWLDPLHGISAYIGKNGKNYVYDSGGSNPELQVDWTEKKNITKILRWMNGQNKGNGKWGYCDIVFSVWIDSSKLTEIEPSVLAAGSYFRKNKINNFGAFNKKPTRSVTRSPSANQNYPRGYPGMGTRTRQGYPGMRNYPRRYPRMENYPPELVGKVV